MLNLAGCVIIQEKSILLLHRIKTKVYELPGGKIDEGESAEQAAKRELQEELCCDIIIIKRLGNKNFTENGFTMNYTWFLANIKDNQQPKVGEPEKFDHYRWIPLDKLREYPLSQNMKNIAKQLGKFLV